jgi:hypothetical protein
MSKILKLDLEKLMSQVTLEVQVVVSRRFRVRKAIAFALLRLAVWMLGCGLEVGRIDEESV